MQVDPGTLWRTAVALEISVQPGPGRTVVRLTGILGVTTRAHLAGIVSELLDTGHLDLTFQVDGLHVVDPAGVAALEWVQHLTHRAGGHATWDGTPTRVLPELADPETAPPAFRPSWC